MICFLLRDIPKPVHTKLKQLAKRQRRSMRQALLAMIEAEIARTEAATIKPT